MTGIRVGGLARLSSCDWPDQLVATVFCQGCPWRCPYCHNPHLRPAEGVGNIPWEDVLAFLERRRGLLDGVVFSGGEPTAQAALVDAARAVRAMGFRVGLHSGGPDPDRLAAILPELDWVGFDVKAPFEDYPRITRAAGSGEAARTSLRRLLESGVAYEVRTTVRHDLLDNDDVERLMRTLARMGVTHYVLQRFRPPGGLLPAPLANDVPVIGHTLFADYRIR